MREVRYEPAPGDLAFFKAVSRWPSSYHAEMNDLVLRAMTPADVPMVAGLSGQLGYPASPDQVARRFERILPKQDHVLVIAEDLGRAVLGWVHAYAVLSLESEPYAEIGGLVVDHRHRRRGIGRALVAEVERWARGQGLNRMRVRSNVTREEAHRFYPGIGFDLLKTQRAYGRPLS